MALTERQAVPIAAVMLSVVLGLTTRIRMIILLGYYRECGVRSFFKPTPLVSTEQLTRGALHPRRKALSASRDADRSSRWRSGQDAKMLGAADELPVTGSTANHSILVDDYAATENKVNSTCDLSSFENAIVHL